MIIETSLQLDLLAEVFEAAEQRRVSLERFTATAQIPLQSVFWLFGADSPRHEVAADPSITEVRTLSRSDEATLFRARHPRDLPIVEAYTAAVANDTVLLDAVGNVDGWWLKLWLPDREGVRRFREDCRDVGISIEVRSVYADDPRPSGERYGLTDCQWEILQLALQRGYFTIPRETSLAELAAELDISGQAASERLRRGMRTLTRNILDEHYPIVRNRLRRGRT